MNKKNTNHGLTCAYRNLPANVITSARAWPNLMVSGLAVGFALLPLSLAHAQFIRLRGGQIRVTVPLHSANPTVITNQVRLNGMNSSGANLSISGLPPGAGATIDINPAPTNNTPINITL